MLDQTPADISQAPSDQTTPRWRVPGSHQPNPLTNWAMLADWLEASIGYRVEPDKYYLLESKVLPLVEELAIVNLDQLIVIIERDTQMRQLLINSVTINETFFFRESTFWAGLTNDVIPHLIAEVQTAGRKTLNILICACSRGQEVWSLSMLLNEQHAWNQQVNFQITATDIDDTVLASAKAGTYTEHDLKRGLSPERQQKHLQAEGALFRVRQHLRTNVNFRLHNLMDDATGLGRFDLILCRNVLIYFTPDVKVQVLRRLSQSLSDSGVILIGGCETVSDASDFIRRFRIGSAQAYQ